MKQSEEFETQLVRFVENLPDRPILIATPVFLLGFSLVGWSKPAWDYHALAVSALIAFHAFLYALWNWLWRIDRKNPRHAITGYWAKFGTISLFTALFFLGATMIAANAQSYRLDLGFYDWMVVVKMALIALGVGITVLFGGWTMEIARSEPWTS